MVFAVGSAPLSLTADDPKTENWRVVAHTTYKVFAAEMKDISDWCIEQELPEQAKQTLALAPNRDPHRQYIFLPGDTANSPKRTALTDEKIARWQSKVDAAQHAHGERLFQLALDACAGGDGATAFKLLHEVLHFSPTHERARKILGHRKTESGWVVAKEKIRKRRVSKPHPRMNWPARDYIMIATPHFNIASKADEETTKLLAAKLERWHRIWRQVYFEYWSHTKTLARWIEKGETRIPGKKFDVVFFASDKQYAEELERWVPGIGESLGYYESTQKTSFYYASEDPEIHNTWRHEASHQWFQETIRAKPQPFDNGFAWLGEGIAMHFESLTDFGSYVTLGGFDARRIQYARVRRLREQYFVPLKEASSLGRVAFQRRADRSRLYSQSAGITHMLMDAGGGAKQRQLIEFLKLMYTGRLKKDTFEKLMGQPFEQLDEQYERFITVGSDEISRYLLKPLLRTELAVPDSRLDVDSVRAIGQCHNLVWLDLTRNNVQGDLLSGLQDCDQLTRLYLSGCLVDSGTFDELAKMKALTNLDLSGSSVLDRHLDQLLELKSVTFVRVDSTRVSDEKIAELANLKPELKIIKE